MRQGSRFYPRFVLYLLLGVLAYAIDDWAREQQSVYLFMLQFVCLAAITVADISKFVSGRLKYRPDEESVNLLENGTFQKFLGIYLLMLAAVVLANIGNESTDFLMSPLGLWLVFLPIMIAALFISQAYYKTR